MKESEAREGLNVLLVALQQFLFSTDVKDIDADVRSFLSSESMHWTICGDMEKAIVDALDKSPLKTEDFYNLMTFATSDGTKARAFFEHFVGEMLPPSPNISITLDDGWDQETEGVDVSNAWSVGWSIGGQTDDGWRNVTTVHAASEAEAQAESERILKRPGRYGIWRIWNEKGRQVRQKEIV